MAEVKKRENVMVHFVDDKEVETHVKHIAKTPKRGRKSKVNASSILCDLHHNPKVNLSHSIDESDDLAKGLIQVELYKDSNLKENAVYSFVTKKKSKGVNNFANEIVRKNLELLKSAKKEKKTTEKNQYDDKYNFQVVNAFGNDDSSLSDEVVSDSDNDEGEDLRSDQQDRGTFKLPSQTELYFEANKGTSTLKASTSNRTLAKLKTSKMDKQKFDEILGKHDGSNVSHGKKKTKKISQEVSERTKVEKLKENLIQSHENHFKKWMFYILNDFNILLFGIGSKRDIMSSFANKMLQPFSKLFINGFFPSITIKNLIISIYEDFLKIPWSFGININVAISKICDYYEQENIEPLFLFIYNIEGAGLRNSNAQTILGQLAKCRGIHIIASIDHINAVLMWDQAKMSSFKWLWFDVTTFNSYKEETSYEDSLLLLASGGGTGGSLALSGLVHVARSLTPNARGIFKILAEHQIEECKENANSYNGYLFTDLYQHCREAFLVNSELTLRTQLTEFLDHKLVQLKKGIDGGEYLTIPLDVVTLKEYLEQEI